jgi:hypothetical protein
MHGAAHNSAVRARCRRGGQIGDHEATSGLRDTLGNVVREVARPIWNINARLRARVRAWWRRAETTAVRCGSSSPAARYYIGPWLRRAPVSAPGRAPEEILRRLHVILSGLSNSRTPEPGIPRVPTAAERPAATLNNKNVDLGSEYAAG